MIRPIQTDVIALSRKAQPATAEDLATAADLADTLRSHADHCVGMAANMIGVSKCIIAVLVEDQVLLMLNPEILRKSGAYDAQEGCLSLQGQRPAKRYRSIKLRYQNTAMQTRIQTFSDFTAQIIQHEMDHLSGILI